jgi:hypothetical protein
MKPSLPREPPSNRRSEAIRAAAADPLDWNRFARIATRHHVVGLAHDGLAKAGIAVPAQIAEELRLPLWLWRQSTRRGHFS